ncbi:MAG: MerR family transcriptional regulator [Cyclobacteriaceae bacterium]
MGSQLQFSFDDQTPKPAVQEVKKLSIEKSYYSIGEVAKKLNVNTSLIRFWEKEFSILKPKKNEKGTRKFTKKDIKTIRLIYHVVKEKGYTLHGAKEVLKNNKETIEKEKEVLETLKRVRKFLVEINHRL